MPKLSLKNGDFRHKVRQHPPTSADVNAAGNNRISAPNHSEIEGRGQTRAANVAPRGGLECVLIARTTRKRRNALAIEIQVFYAATELKLTDIALAKGSYVYSTSFRFCFPFTFAPFTTVGTLDREMSKAVSFMWRRNDRKRLPQLHAELYDVLLDRGLQRLRSLALSAYACPYTTPDLWSHGGHHRFKTRSALEILERQAVEKGYRRMFSAELMGSLMSFAPTLEPSREELERAKSEWLPLKC